MASKNRPKIFDMSAVKWYMKRAEGAGRWGIRSDYRQFDNSFDHSNKGDGLFMDDQRRFELTRETKNKPIVGDYMLIWDVDDGKLTAKDAIIVRLDSVEKDRDTSLPYFIAYGTCVRVVAHNAVWMHPPIGVPMEPAPAQSEEARQLAMLDEMAEQSYKM